VFDEVRQAFRELLHGNVTPEGRRELIGVMKDTLVRARLAMDDLRDGVEATRKRVERERLELATIRRRKGLAQGVGDVETVTVAERFEAQLVERLGVLERKLEVQESELALVEREVTEMKEQLKSALAGVGSGMHAGTVDAAADPLDDGRAGLEQQLNEMRRAQHRANANADADAALEELKKRMGR
jgi:chaperonin cofactor prefoldin